MTKQIFDLEMIQRFYAHFPDKVAVARNVLGRPMTLTEKILYAHIDSGMEVKDYKRGDDYMDFNPDRVAMQDATAQMALLQFMQAGSPKVAVPSTVHCDHLIRTKSGAETDLQVAKTENKEVYDFLSSVSNKYGIGFWEPGAGIIHQVVLENYAFPGGMIIGTDSHTVNGGGLGMIAIGVGGSDAGDVMAGLPCELLMPKLIGIKLTGELSGFATPKDIILKVAGLLTVKGGTNAIVEYYGDGATSLSATGKATICNMGAEIGATTSIFSYDENMAMYLEATGREKIAHMANEIAPDLTGDSEVYEDPAKYFDSIHEIDLSTLVPQINGPFTPDLATSILNIAETAKNEGWPLTISTCLIGSCTNSSYEDIANVSSIAQYALDRGLKLQCELIINPGSELVLQTVTQDGLLKPLIELGAKIAANACGACIGMWDRVGAEKQEKNTIIHSFNRNFAKRADGNPHTYAFVASPVIVMAYALAGTLEFNPITSSIDSVILPYPSGNALPRLGFSGLGAGYEAPAEDGSQVEVIIDPNSERLQLLEPFSANKPDDFIALKLLIKAKGKCTTDHISMAGPWLKFRGHLDNISNNMLIGATNFFNEKTDCVKNQITGEYDTAPNTQRAYKAAGIGSIVVGEENYGEGSSREHAAMEPRHLGVKAVLVKSFARIHETNLKKQGMLALTFSNPDDYSMIQEDDEISIDMTSFAPGSKIRVTTKHASGGSIQFLVNHSYNQQQIEWFWAGAALNMNRIVININKDGYVEPNKS